MELDLWSEWEGDQIGTVDPVDLRSVWVLCRDMQAQSRPTGKSRVIDVAGLQCVCSLGADVRDVWYRASMLLMLEARTNVLAPWMHDCQLDEVVYQVAAIFPVKKMRIGVVNDGLPFDVREFIRKVEAAAPGPSGT